jgi:ribosomal protein S12 methylthiotransferase accessory factor YcaO
MKISRPVKRAILVILICHTLVFAGFVILEIFSKILPENPLIAATFAVIAAILTPYTAHLITTTVDEELAARLEILSKAEAKFKALSELMENSAKELTQRSEMMKECQRELERRAAVMRGYSDKMTELLTELNAADNDTVNE